MSTTTESTASDAGTTDIRLGYAITIGGLLFVVGEGIPLAVTSAPVFAPWWNAGAVAVVAAFVVLGVAGLALPLRVLRVFWAAIPIATALLLGLSSAAAPATALPWLWAVEPASICFLVLVARPTIAIAGGLASASLPAVSNLLFAGELTRVIAGSTLIHLGNVALVVILLALRGRLGIFRAAEDDARRRERQRAQLAADAAAQTAFARIVHDEVLAVLSAATFFPGTPPDELRAEARSALAILDGTDDLDRAGALVPADAAADRIGRRLREIAPHAGVRVDAHPGSLPEVVVEVVAGAAAEAVRNAVRHAGTGAGIRGEVYASDTELRVRVVDDGTGFDPARIDPERLGVRGSIIGRMQALDGGDAVLTSSAATGTEVRLAWHR